MPSQKTRNSPSDSERISDEVKRILREQTIDQTRPGTILHDFDALLDFVGEEVFYAVSGSC